MRPAELKTKINKMIDERLKANGSVELAWLINKLVAECNLSTDGQNEPSMTFIAAREGLRNIVGGANRKRKANVKNAAGISAFPGFDRLQRAYSLNLDNERWLTPIEKMSVVELVAKKMELAEISYGLGEHICEIDRGIRLLTAHPHLSTLGEVSRFLYGYVPDKAMNTPLAATANKGDDEDETTP